MTETLSTISAEITTDCICETYDESNGESVPSDYCYGCYDESLQDFRDNILSPWIDAIGADEDTDILVEGTGLGWQSRAGWIIVDAGSVHDALKINGEYRIEYRFDGTALTARRWSHDEPTGTGVFTFALAPEDAD